MSPCTHTCYKRGVFWESGAEGSSLDLSCGAGRRWKKQGKRAVCLEGKTRTLGGGGEWESLWMLWRQCCPLARRQETPRLTALGNTRTHTPVVLAHSWDLCQTLLFLLFSLFLSVSTIHVQHTHYGGEPSTSLNGTLNGPCQGKMNE